MLTMVSNKMWNVVYVDRNKLSFGQKTVGALLLIMHGATELGDMIP